MSIEDIRSERLQEPEGQVAALVAPTREPSALTRSAIEAWVRDKRSSRSLPAIEAAACAVLEDLLEDFARTYAFNDVRDLAGGTDVRSMPDLAKRLRVVAGRLREQHGADQVMQVHHVDRQPLWVSFDAPAEAARDDGSIEYREVPVELTWLGRLIYGRLPSRSRWSAPMVYPTLRVVIPFFVSLGLFYSWLIMGNTWLAVLALAAFLNLAVAAFRLLKLPITQAKRVEWPYVRGDGKFGVLHTRARLEGQVLFQIKAYQAGCSICGDVVDIEPGRHAFEGRFVGECRSNPLEHLFSFDHTTGKGWHLHERGR